VNLSSFSPESSRQIDHDRARSCGPQIRSELFRPPHTSRMNCKNMDLAPNPAMVCTTVSDLLTARLAKHGASVTEQLARLSVMGDALVGRGAASAAGATGAAEKTGDTGWAGRLQVRLVRGCGLQAVNNRLHGLSDPYVELVVRRTGERVSSRRCLNTVEPRWHESRTSRASPLSPCNAICVIFFLKS
jgi:C2 domain